MTWAELMDLLLLGNTCAVLQGDLWAVREVPEKFI